MCAGPRCCTRGDRRRRTRLAARQRQQDRPSIGCPSLAAEKPPREKDESGDQHSIESRRGAGHACPSHKERRPGHTEDGGRQRRVGEPVPIDGRSCRGGQRCLRISSVSSSPSGSLRRIRAAAGCVSVMVCRSGATRRAPRDNGGLCRPTSAIPMSACETTSGFSEGCSATRCGSVRAPRSSTSSSACARFRRAAAAEATATSTRWRSCFARCRSNRPCQSRARSRTF